ncbi:hypothetical protein M2165_004172 [Variovorax sp. TBS-050B]|uniref:hypothetical protein n=1 Tax=Variovorax sp. TBS-050B TaxID=2940551 RepID=UPI0024760914|nr:hypothetical protein [Variovorax sp. TBS-050B]MDH6594283.1 hypothetical protein [Variovorax sp. TBS-050B]
MTGSYIVRVWTSPLSEVGSVTSTVPSGSAASTCSSLSPMLLATSASGFRSSKIALRAVSPGPLRSSGLPSSTVRRPLAEVATACTEPSLATVRSSVVPSLL